MKFFFPLKRKIICALIVISTVFLFNIDSYALSGNGEKLIGKLLPKEAPELIIPEVKDVTLSNGMRCFLREDHLLPVMQFSVIFPGGKVYDPYDKTGLTYLLARALRGAGTINYTADQFDQKLDSMAINLNIDFGKDHGTAGLSSLSEFSDEALEMFFEMIFSPAFDAERVEIFKKNMVESIRRQNDDPGSIGERVWLKTLYGKESPWAISPTQLKIKDLTIADLRAKHATLFAPKQMLCAAAGNFDADDLVEKLEKIITHYPEREPVTYAPPTVAQTFNPGIWLVERPIDQAVINMGHLGVSRDNPDKYALILMNEILGSRSSFNSWLMSNVRTKHGYAYQAWSEIVFGEPNVAGFFRAHSRTRLPVTGKAITLMKEIWSDMAGGERITSDELESMRAAILRRMPFQYESSFELASDKMNFAFLGYPDNYIDIYRSAISKVSLEDVSRVARTYLQPDKLQILVVGDSAKLSSQLESFGKVQKWDLEAEFEAEVK